MNRTIRVTLAASGFALRAAIFPTSSAAAASQCPASPAVSAIASVPSAAPKSADELALSVTTGPAPRAIGSATASTQLIQKLKLARQEDDHNEQRMLNEIAWVGSGDGSGEPAATAQFDEQKAAVDDVIADLENGRAVSQARVERALTVPAL